MVLLLVGNVKISVAGGGNYSERNMNAVRLDSSLRLLVMPRCTLLHHKLILMLLLVTARHHGITCSPGTLQNENRGRVPALGMSRRPPWWPKTPVLFSRGPLLEGSGDARPGGYGLAWYSAV